MKKKLSLTLVLFCFLALTVNSQTIVIDPGHGYCKDGTQNCTKNRRSSIEILTAMSVANKLKSKLDNGCSSVSVKLTRKNSAKGSLISLSARRNMANSWGADRFISVHCNAGGGTGTETFWCNRSKKSGVAFAKKIHSRMVSYGKWKSRRVVEDRSYLPFHLGVLSGINSVACLSEIGFVDSSDKNKLNNDGWRNKFAEAYYVSLKESLSMKCSGGGNTGKSDLIVDRVYTNNANPNKGQAIDLFVKLKNIGKIASTATSFNFRIDGKNLNTRSLPSLGANKTIVLSYRNLKLTKVGNNNYCVYIKSPGNESNTSNNIKCTNIKVKGSSNTGNPDLVISKMWVDPSKPKVGATTTLYVTVKNNGNKTSSATRCKFKLNGKQLIVRSLSSLSAGKSITLSYQKPSNVKIGSNRYCVYVNAASGESNTRNNSYCMNFTAEKKTWWWWKKSNDGLKVTPKEEIITTAMKTKIVRMETIPTTEIEENVKITDQEATSDDKETVLEESAISVEHDVIESQKDFDIYPNPVVNLVNIKSNKGTKVITAIVYNLNGIEVRTFNGNNITSIEVSDLNTGVYVLQILTNDRKSFTYKIIKK